MPNRTTPRICHPDRRAASFAARSGGIVAISLGLGHRTLQTRHSERSEDLFAIPRILRDESLSRLTSARSLSSRPECWRILPARSGGIAEQSPRLVSQSPQSCHPERAVCAKDLNRSAPRHPFRASQPLPGIRSLISDIPCPTSSSLPPLPALQYIVSRHIPRTRPSGVTISLSGWPNTGHLGV